MSIEANVKNDIQASSNERTSKGKYELHPNLITTSGLTVVWANESIKEKLHRHTDFLTSISLTRVCQAGENQGRLLWEYITNIFDYTALPRTDAVERIPGFPTNFQQLSDLRPK